jgi:hypothetical protein
MTVVNITNPTGWAPAHIPMLLLYATSDRLGGGAYPILVGDGNSVLRLLDFAAQNGRFPYQWERY